MALVSSHYKYVFFLLFGAGVFFMSNFKYKQRLSENLSKAADSIIKTVLDTIPNFHKTNLEIGKEFPHEKDISPKDQNNVKNKKIKKNRRKPREYFDIYDTLEVFDQIITTNAPLHTHKQLDSKELFESNVPPNYFVVEEATTSDRQLNINEMLGDNFDNYLEYYDNLFSYLHEQQNSNKFIEAMPNSHEDYIRIEESTIFEQQNKDEMLKSDTLDTEQIYLANVPSSIYNQPDPKEFTNQDETLNKLDNEQEYLTNVPSNIYMQQDIKEFINKDEMPNKLGMLDKEEEYLTNVPSNIYMQQDIKEIINKDEMPNKLGMLDKEEEYLTNVPSNIFMQQDIKEFINKDEMPNNLGMLDKEEEYLTNVPYYIYEQQDLKELINKVEMFNTLDALDKEQEPLINMPSYIYKQPDSKESINLMPNNEEDYVSIEDVQISETQPISDEMFNEKLNIEQEYFTNAPTYMKQDSKVSIELLPNSNKDYIFIEESPISEQQLYDVEDFNYKQEILLENYTSSSILSESQKIELPVKNPAFIIDTTGCRIPKLDPWDPSVLEFVEILNPLVCSDLPLFMTPEPNGIVHLNESVLEKYYNSAPEDIECFYAGVDRLYEPYMIREDVVYRTHEKPLIFNTPIDFDHIAVKCNFKNYNYTYEQYIPLVRLKDKNLDKADTNPSKLNVILLGIDSISKLNFMRHFRQTKAFLEDKMNVFDMKGYTKVGDNTFPNLVPMLTGHFVDYYWNESMADTYFFDNMSLIWKDYSRHGYKTFYAEDKPYHGTFNYFRRGFFEQPTDYYYRALALMIEASNLRKEANTYNSTCLNSELEMDLINDYLKNFVKTMDKRPFFAFAMHSTLTHDVLNYASYADAPTVRLLKALDDEKTFNNTLLVIFSDHGLRYGDLRFTYIGKFEERMPFMYIHVPKWFLKLNPAIEKNLIINQDRLITLFDIHATLKHLLNPNQFGLEDTDELGLSLFNEIPENRTCEDANIRPHWCPCTDFKPAPKTDPIVLNVAYALINYINELLLLHADVCEKLNLHEVNDALFGIPNELVLKFVGHKGVVENAAIGLGDIPPTLGDYLITVTTQPGGAVIEGTVRYDEENHAAKVMGVSRINTYGSQSWCIDDAKIKLFCFCKEQLS